MAKVKYFRDVRYVNNTAYAANQTRFHYTNLISIMIQKETPGERMVIADEQGNNSTTEDIFISPPYSATVMPFDVDAHIWKELAGDGDNFIVTGLRMED